MLPKRSEIAKRHTWNAESVFETQEAWEAAFKDAQAMLPETKRFVGHLGDNPQVLADWFDLAEKIYLAVGKIFIYASMSNSVDTNDQKATAMNDRAQGLFGQTMAAMAFSRPEILAIGHDTLKQWMKEESCLTYLEHYFDNLFREQKSVRSAEVEGIMGMVSESFGGVYTIIGMLTNADFKFQPAVGVDGKEYPVAQSTISDMMHNPDRQVRRMAWENYADVYLAHKNTVAATYTTSVKQDIFQVRVRGYGSSLEAALFPYNIPTEVFENLIATYKKHIPTWHRYWAIRRRAMGVETLHPYDIWAPIAKDHPVVSYEKAVDWVCDGLSPLGDAYVAALRKGCLEERWVDIYPNEGKSAGAFSDGWHNTHPFIMMSYADTLSSMSTLAHELGHSMHSYLTRKHQPFIYGNYSMFVAEVASNFNQAMTRAYLFEHNNDPNFQIALIEEAMDNFHRYFFIMPTLARFEHEVHQRMEKGESMTADDLINLMADLFSEGYGTEMHVDRERVGITWAQFGHLYASYYTFQYATGISGAHALSNRILRGEQGAAEAYLGLLSAGGSKYAIDALKQAGVDLATPQPVEETFKVLEGLIDRLDQLTR